MKQRIDLTGQRFNRLTVLRFDHTGRNGSYWLCRCDCGAEKVLPGFNLRSGGVTSCGCQRGRPGIKRDVAEFTRKHGCSVCADKKSCDMKNCKYEKELIK